MADDLATLRVTLEANSARYTKELEKVDKRLSRFEKTQKSSITRLKKSFSSLGAGIAAVGAVGLARGVLRQADAMQVLDQRIKSATDSTGDYATVSKELLDISQRNGVELASTVDLYQRLSFSAEALGATSSDILQLANTVQQLGVIGGTTKQQMDNALLQFSQMLGQSKPQAEELNSILDSMPLLAKRIEKGLNLLPGSLKTAVKEGRVLTQEIFTTLLAQSDEVNAKFQEMPLSIERASTQLGNAWDNFIKRSDDASSATAAVARGIEAIALLFYDDRSAEDKHLLAMQPHYERLLELKKQLAGPWYKRQFIGGQLEAQLELQQGLIDKLEAEYDIRQELASITPVNVAASRKEGSIVDQPKAKAGTSKSRGQNAALLAAADQQMALELSAQKQKGSFAQLQSELLAQQQAAQGKQLASLDEYLQMPMERLQAAQTARMDMLNKAHEDELLSDYKFYTMKYDMEKKHEEERSQLVGMSTSMQLQNASQLFDGLAGLSEAFGGKQSASYRAMFAISKAFAIADSIVKIQTGIASAASLPFPSNIGAMASVASATSSIISTIQGTKIDGARALGGPVLSGGDYLVGEKGPEILSMGSKSGNITPNSALGGIVVNINEDASRAGQVERNGNELTVFVAAATNAVFSEFDAGSSRARRVEKRYGLTRRAG